MHTAKAGTVCLPAWKSLNSHISLAPARAYPLWLRPNLLSLDAPLIAVLWLHLFAIALHVRISPPVTLVLALVVWLIYVADRLMDGLRAEPWAVLSARHQFYRAHRGVFACLLSGVLVLTGCVCLKLDRRTLELGTMLMLVIAGYFTAVHHMRKSWGLRFPKEIVVAMVFGIGTTFPAWIHAPRATPLMAIGLAFFIAICWLNLVLIEYAEWLALGDQGSETPHRSTMSAGKHLYQISAGLAFVALCLSRSAAAGTEHWMLLAIALSALALAVLGFYRRELSIHKVRVLADVTLLTPAIVLIMLHS
jgi:hypothetical protein